MNPKTLLFIAIFTLPLIFTGCSTHGSSNGGNYKILNSKDTTTPSSIEMSYSNFEGYKYKVLDLKKDDNLTITTDVNTEYGDLKIALISEAEEEIFKIESSLDDITKTIQISADGKYKIMVQGTHSGSYKVNWAISH